MANALCTSSKVFLTPELPMLFWNPTLSLSHSASTFNLKPTDLLHDEWWTETLAHFTSMRINHKQKLIKNVYYFLRNLKKCQYQAKLTLTLMYTSTKNKQTLKLPVSYMYIIFLANLSRIVRDFEAPICKRSVWSVSPPFSALKNAVQFLNKPIDCGPWSKQHLHTWRHYFRRL